VTKDGPIQVLIIGGGVSGLTAAAALIDAGIEPVVIEAAESIEAETNPGVVELWPEALSLLEDLGVAEDIYDASTVVDTWTERRSSGTVTHRREADAVGLVTIPYDTLRDRVSDALPAHVVQTGRTVQSVERKADRVVAAFANDVREPFDAVIGADGARSQTRRAVCGRTLDDCGTQTWTFPVPAWSRSGETTEIWTPEGVVFRVLPTPHGGRGRLTLPTDYPPSDAGGRRPVTGLDDAQSVIEWLLPAALRHAHTAQIRREIDVRLSTPVWGTHRVAFVGDAAHARSQLTGVGATLAVEDGVALATALSKRTEPVRDRIADYAACRTDRLARLERESTDPALPPDPNTAAIDRYRPAVKVRAANITAHFTTPRDPD
jgi:2-polyprenyl-6-methoxyphenol hydroxylase-like FAD-dependent oxidoreductase